MLIGLCGGIAAGKAAVADYLVKYDGFKRLYVEAPTSGPTSPASLIHRRSTSVKSISQTDGSQSIFPDAKALIGFVTKRWRERWVTTDILDEAALETLIHRPFFLLVSVDAPISLRWQRYQEQCKSNSETIPDLEAFIRRNDEHLYHRAAGIAGLIDRAQVRLINSSSSLTSLHSQLHRLHLPDETRLRPSWDQYFMQLASLAAQRSNCMKRRVGCVLVREKRVISTGYNGTPRGIKNCNEGGCQRCNQAAGSGQALSTCLCMHAEENALLEAGRERIREDSVLYCDTCPCLTCSIKISQVGIKEVVYSKSFYMDNETAAVFREAGVQFRQFSPPARGLVNLGDD